VYGISRGVDWSPLCTWFERWFDVEDTRQPDDDGLNGVIHFLSDPEYKGAATVFQVDFGSAPEEAFEELLDALRDSGATKIEIGNDHGGCPPPRPKIKSARLHPLSSVSQMPMTTPPPALPRSSSSSAENPRPSRS